MLEPKRDLRWKSVMLPAADEHFCNINMWLKHEHANNHQNAATVG
jgi:hypothetical protein